MRQVLIRRSSCWIFSQRSLLMRWASASCSVDNMRWCFTTKMNIICLVQHTTTEMIDWVKIYCIQQFTKQFTSLRNKTAVSERPRTVVPVGLLRSGRRCRHSAAPAFHQPSTTCSTSLPAQHLRPSGLFSCQLHSLELSPWFHPAPDHQCRLFQTFV